MSAGRRSGACVWEPFVDDCSGPLPHQNGSEVLPKDCLPTMASGHISTNSLGVSSPTRILLGDKIWFVSVEDADSGFAMKHAQ